MAAESLLAVESKPMVPFWGRYTTHVRTYFSGDWDVFWGFGILTHYHFESLKCLHNEGPTFFFCLWPTVPISG